MHFLRLVFIQCKLNFKDIPTLINLIVHPIVVTLGLEIIFQIQGSPAPLFAVFNYDQGQLADQMFEQLDIDTITVGNLEEGLAQLQAREIAGVFEINEEFTQLLESGSMPEVILHQWEERNLSSLEGQVQQFLQERARQGLFNEHGIIYESQALELEFIQDEGILESLAGGIPLTLIFCYLIINSGRIAQKLSGLKSNKVLKRLTATNNENFTILSSLCVSYFLTQGILLGFTSFVLKVFLNYRLGSLLSLIITLLLLNLLSISLGIVLARITKNVILIDWSSIVFAFILVGFGIFAREIPFANIPGFVNVVAQLSPFYWTLEILFNGNLFPGVWMLLLMSSVLLTAGSLKRNQFLQE